MIAQHLGGAQPGEHIRGVVYLGEGPLVNAGAAPVLEKDQNRSQHTVGGDCLSWLQQPVLAEGYNFRTDMGSEFVLCSLVTVHPRLGSFTNRLNGNASTAWRLLLDDIKRTLDEPGRQRGRRLAGEHEIHYASHFQKSGSDRNIRVFWRDAGLYLGSNVLALVAACSNKKEERSILQIIKGNVVKAMH